MERKKSVIGRELGGTGKEHAQGEAGGSNQRLRTAHEHCSRLATRHHHRTRTRGECCRTRTRTRTCIATVLLLLLVGRERTGGTTVVIITNNTAEKCGDIQPPIPATDPPRPQPFPPSSPRDMQGEENSTYVNGSAASWGGRDDAAVARVTASTSRTRPPATACACARSSSGWNLINAPPAQWRRQIESFRRLCRNRKKKEM